MPDLSGIARGKILPADKFLRSQADDAPRLPESIFTPRVTGDFINTNITDPVAPHIVLGPDPKSLRVVPRYEEPRAVAGR